MFWSFLFLLIALPCLGMEVACFSAPVCQMLNEVHHPEVSKIQPLILSDDPHHAEIPPQILQKMLTADYLILPQINRPWVQGLKEKKKKNLIFFPATFQPPHFWLESEKLCSFYQEMLSLLNQWSHSSITQSCPTEYLQLVEKFKSWKEKLTGQQIVLAHDNLENIFTPLSTLSLGHEISHWSPKKLQQLEQNKKRTLWILDAPHAHAQKSILARWMKPQDQVMVWAVEGTDPKAKITAPLMALLQQPGKTP